MRKPYFLLTLALLLTLAAPAFAEEPNGEDSAAALRLRAQHRGIELPTETERFLLRRTRRDVQSLYGLLDRLAAAALHEERRLTVPFVRTLLEGDG